MSEEKLSLANICEGKLNGQFQRQYPEVFSDLKAGQKASVTISLTLSRPEGSTMMASISGKIAVKMPAAASVTGLYAFNDKYEIKADMPQEEPAKQGVIPFPNTSSN